MCVYVCVYIQLTFEQHKVWTAQGHTWIFLSKYVFYIVIENKVEVAKCLEAKGG